MTRELVSCKIYLQLPRMQCTQIDEKNDRLRNMYKRKGRTNSIIRTTVEVNRIERDFSIQEKLAKNFLDKGYEFLAG